MKQDDDDQRWSHWSVVPGLAYAQRWRTERLRDWHRRDLNETLSPDRRLVDPPTHRD